MPSFSAIKFFNVKKSITVSKTELKEHISETMINKYLFKHGKVYSL